MNSISIRKDYAAARSAVQAMEEDEVRSAKVECYAKVGRAVRQQDAAVEDAWAAYHASPLTRREAIAQLNAALDAAAEEYKVAEAEAIRAHNRVVYPATSAYQVAMSMLAAERNLNSTRGTREEDE